MLKLRLFVAFITSIIWVPGGMLIYSELTEPSIGESISLLSLFSEPSTDKSIIILSLSSDGRYVVGNKENDLYLWDIENKTKKRVANKINVYSPYFIKNSSYFLYQDLDNVVHVRSVNGEEIKSFDLGFPSYGNLMTTDLIRYFAVDIGYQIIKVEEGNTTIVKGRDNPEAFYSGKLLNLSLSSDDSLLLSVGYCSGPPEPRGKELFFRDEISHLYSEKQKSCTALWNTATSQPEVIFRSLSYKSSGTLSPDKKYFIGTDQSGYVSIVDLMIKKYTKFMDIGQDVYLFTTDDERTKGVIHNSVLPPASNYRTNNYSTSGLRVLFITPTEYLKFNHDYSYAFLYDINNVLPLAYLDLGIDPFPSVRDYSRNGSIDTAPAVHRVVTGKHSEPGIMVYDYNPEAKTLTKIWDSP